LKSVEVLKRTRVVDFERLCGKQSNTLGEFTPEERQGIEQELSKAEEPDFM
jgi:hypothetical protein